MQLFYDPYIGPGQYRLRESEAQHAARVLRKRVGDRLDVVDGQGGWYRGEILNIDKRECLLDVVEIRRQAKRAKHTTTLLVAPTKNIDRFEWIVEKGTEIGLDRILPVITAHSERKKLRIDRLERIAESAMKQCLLAWLPVIEELRPLAEVITELPENGQKIMPYLGADDSPLLRDNYRVGENVSLLIGPEGGFSADEAAMAKEIGFSWVSLGPNRLRTETAAITAVVTVEMMNWNE